MLKPTFPSQGSQDIGVAVLSSETRMLAPLERQRAAGHNASLPLTLLPAMGEQQAPGKAVQQA